ncbi:AbrB family transcriptional regulator [Bifidobacterium vespertilionis]|uniref:AbrB family transcriptional regulator n=1 Tax=Bifidobacterium vespertilionis TaxID=2562524 RepID=A0A5J5DXC4_9BIFI|nr:AbrB family transcriptional regulator [Bifidobacterium vespertilionis]KAA8821362.1 AbrB family transcriptional regulator [Bifidobacterium vespertilionis]KAA8824307.1 AbrB family transcriptional regulator [Bifidobacterium vespertilionis]
MTDSENKPAEDAKPDEDAKPAGSAKPAAPHEDDTLPDDFEPLTVTYERLRHSSDPAELSSFARTPLPDRADQAAFSRATALLEAVAGNEHTPVEDRIFLGETMPFPNILVKLSSDPVADVRRAVAGNKADKNWLVGRLTKDPVPEVRDAALLNPRTSWKMRLEGAQNPDVDAETLDFLGKLGTELEPDAPGVLASMVRRAVAGNPNTTPETRARLAQDPSGEVARQARRWIESHG